VKRKLSKVLAGGLFLVHVAIVGQPVLGLSRMTLFIVAIALVNDGLRKKQRGFDDGLN
jgi:hypothetical protein